MEQRIGTVVIAKRALRSVGRLNLDGAAMESDGFKQIRRLRRDRHTCAIVEQLKAEPAESFGGGCTACNSIWDAWKLELQDEESMMFEFIDGHVRMVVESYVNELAWDEVALLAMIVPCDAGPEQMTEEERDDVVEELIQAVNSLAANEPHHLDIRATLDEREIDRLERDNDVYG